MSADKPRLVIASRVFGASGQPWLWRQVSDLQGFRKSVICWERHNAEKQPLTDVPISLLAEDPAPYDGGRRWKHRLRTLPGLNFYAAAGEERRRLAELMRREAPALILCYFGDIAMRLQSVAAEAGIPIVAYFHGDFQFLYNRWYRWSLRQSISHFASIVVVTEAERKWLVANGVPTRKLFVIPCGAPTELFQPASPITSRRVRFVMASRLIGEKGCDVSIEAFSLVASELGDVELHIYGDGPARAALESQVEILGLASRVHFHGYVDEQQLARSLQSYDVFIQHSLNKEGSPVSIAEAMACGLPVIATPVGGIAEQVRHGTTGLLVAERDVRGMAESMRRLSRDRELRQMLGRAGRDRAVREYDSSSQTRCLERVLLRSLV